MPSNCWLRIANVPFMMILKHLVRGNISLVMLKDLRGISLDGRGLSLHARGGGTDTPVLHKRTYVPDVKEQTFLFLSCVVWYSPIRKMVYVCF